MQKVVRFEDLGMMDYKEAWDYQKILFEEIMKSKVPQPSARRQKNTIKNHLLFCEHPHVYTLGKSGSQENLLIDFLKLQNINAGYYRIDRGGDITYHGPGQIVGYPILDLEVFGMGVKQYIWTLEEAVILTLKEYSINAGRLEGATGVWIFEDSTVKENSDKGIIMPMKICAIGVKTSRFVSMHGFAFNVNTDLTYFNYINPCGFTDKAVTSMEKELGGKQDFEQVKKSLKRRIVEIFGMELVQ